MMWNFTVDESQENARYGMIIGQDLLSELQIYLCLSDYTTRGNGGAYEGCTTSMRYTNNGYVIIPYGQLDGASFKEK